MVVIGAGAVGVSAARVVAGMDAEVVLIDLDAERLRAAEPSCPAVRVRH